MEALVVQLRAEIASLQAPVTTRPQEIQLRVPSNLPKFKGRRGDDVRQWLLQVETLCRIHGHDPTDDNKVMPSIAGTAMEDPASGWFLFWASHTSAENQTWSQFNRDALSNFEASNYQAALR